MARWLTFIKERFPPVSYLLLTGGFTVSAMYISTTPFTYLGAAIAFFGILLFFAQLRLMDEFKDYEKDKIAHPERPLPRGLISPEEAEKGIKVLNVSLIAFSFAAAYINQLAGMLYLFVAFYLYLMYKEFFCGEALSQRPFWYAVTHQIIVLPLVGFAAACFDQTSLLTPDAIGYSLIALGGFFTYEICRKLDPKADAVLGTYLIHYGAPITWLQCLITTSIAAYGTYVANATFLWPIEAAVLLSLGIIIIKPTKFKLVELLATLSLIAHLWALCIKHFTL